MRSKKWSQKKGSRIARVVNAAGLNVPKAVVDLLGVNAQKVKTDHAKWITGRDRVRMLQIELNARNAEYEHLRTMTHRDEKALSDVTAEMVRLKSEIETTQATNEETFKVYQNSVAEYQHALERAQEELNKALEEARSQHKALAAQLNLVAEQQTTIRELNAKIHAGDVAKGALTIALTNNHNLQTALDKLKKELEDQKEQSKKDIKKLYDNFMATERAYEAGIQAQTTLEDENRWLKVGYGLIGGLLALVGIGIVSKYKEMKANNDTLKGERDKAKADYEAKVAAPAPPVVVAPKEEAAVVEAAAKVVAPEVVASEVVAPEVVLPEATPKALAPAETPAPAGPTAAEIRKQANDALAALAEQAALIRANLTPVEVSREFSSEVAFSDLRKKEDELANYETNLQRAQDGLAAADSNLRIAEKARTSEVIGITGVAGETGKPLGITVSEDGSSNATFQNLSKL